MVITKEYELRRIANRLGQTASLYGYQAEHTQRFKKNGDAVIEITLKGIEDDDDGESGG